MDANEFYSALDQAKGPAGLAVGINLMLVQVLQAWDHLLPVQFHKPGTSDISKPMAITLAWLVAIPLYLCCLYGLALPLRGANFGYGIVGGLGGLAVSALLDKAGWNLDKVFGQKDEP